MSEQPQRTGGESRAPSVAQALRSSALGLFIGGGVCLYLGFAWLVDAPGAADEEAVETWYAIDRAFQWCLRIIGVILLLAAALAMAGRRLSALVALIGEALFTLLFAGMVVETILEARADGYWDNFVILLLLLLVFGIIGVRQSLSLWLASRDGPVTGAQGES